MEDKNVIFTIGGRNVLLEEAMEFLGSIPLLQQLPAESIRKIAQVVQPMHYGPGETLVKEGEPGEGFYIVWNGQAEVNPPSESGVTTNVLKQGDYFGSACPDNLQELHKADVIAVDGVTCLVLPHKHHDLVSPASIWTENDNKAIATVERILELDKLDVDLFLGLTWYKFGHGRVFGGQLIGQALAAASKSVDPSLLIHSLHSYFVRVGDETFPIIYHVQRVRDGHRFATRHVTATQKGQEIFRLTASFQRPEGSERHQIQMPNAPRPEDLPSRETSERRYQVDARIPSSIRKKLATAPYVQYPIDMRSCDPVDLVNPAKLEPRQRVWLRARQKLSNDQALHCCVAAYASDLNFTYTAMRPFMSTPSKRFRMLSLDHSMWFHRPFRADEWLLFVMGSPVARGGRALAIGHMFTESGKLVVSVTQEGIFQQYVRKSKL